MLLEVGRWKHKKQKKRKSRAHSAGCVCSVDRNAWRAAVYVRSAGCGKHGRIWSMEELVYQLKAPIAGTSHDLLMSYVCSSALIAAAALHPSDSGQHFSSGKRKAHVAFGLICIAAGAASIVYSINDVGSTGRKRLSEKSEHVQYRGRRQLRRSGPREYHVPGTETKSDLSLSGIHGEHLRRQILRRSIDKTISRS